MATPLNVFKTTTKTLSDSDENFGALGTEPFVYRTPAGVTSIVLMAQVANIDPTDRTVGVTFIHKDVGTQVETKLVNNFAIQANDASGVLTGKLIVQENNEILAYTHRYNGTDDTNNSLVLTLSYLESLNG
jgi:hypothetical protein